jgi:hypothetical protein
MIPFLLKNSSWGTIRTCVCAYYYRLCDSTGVFVNLSDTIKRQLKSGLKLNKEKCEFKKPSSPGERDQVKSSRRNYKLSWQIFARLVVSYEADYAAKQSFRVKISLVLK